MGILGRINKILGRQSAPPPVAPPAIRFADLAEYPDETLIPSLDRRELDEASLTPAQAAWRRDGVLHLPGFIPDAVSEPYLQRRIAHKKKHGWLIATPYMYVPEMRDLALYPPLMAKMKEVIGEDMMLHLCLTGWMSSQRGWHQDDYLNPPFVNSWYAAVWIALGDIHPASGPFQYIPGSHRWPLLRGEKVRQFLTAEELAHKAPRTGINPWEKFAERFLSPAIEHEIKAFGRPPVSLLAKRGDVLIWHGRLIHQGSLPEVPGMERRSLIAHYSGVNHRPDMPERAQDQNDETYAVFHTPMVD